ncbi:MAG: ribosome small subunit-dependent GTPase A [Acidobacteria bacterium]|nr:MAG: ribosome small subunit-dependent GTPase A [Acidobacteriota bacterium]
MKKKRFVKRSARSLPGQERQRLRRRAQELLAGDGTAGDLFADRPAAATPAARPRGAPGAAAEEDAREAVVVAVASGRCQVDDGGRRIDCVLPSRLAREQRSRLAAGDRVRYARRRDGSARVLEVLPRTTVLSRPDPHNPRRRRVIAANVEVVVHVVSLRQPPLRPGLIDRFLLAIESSGAEPLLCANKIDLVPAGERTAALAPLAPYRRLGVPVLPCSARTGEGVEALRARLAGRSVALVGHSGVGKSSLLNALAGGEIAVTGSVGGRGKGRHVTTRADLHRLPGDLRVIDTPGIRELGLWRIEPRRLARLFPDLDPLARECRFNDCSHLHEPGCGVRAGVADGRLEAARYDAYARIYRSLIEDPQA